EPTLAFLAQNRRICDPRLIVRRFKRRPAFCFHSNRVIPLPSDNLEKTARDHVRVNEANAFSSAKPTFRHDIKSTLNFYRRKSLSLETLAPRLHHKTFLRAVVDLA